MDTNKETNSMRDLLAGKLIATNRKINLTLLKVDEIARIMEVSKVTMYKYFSSKDEIMETVADIIEGYILNGANIDKKEDNFIEQYVNLFEQSLYLVYYISNHLINFKEYKSELYNKLLVAKQHREEQLTDFYTKGEKLGFFHPVNTSLLILSDEVILTKILDPSYLIQNGLSLETTLFDYYQNQKRIIFLNEYINKVDNKKVVEIIRKFKKKNSHNL